MFSVEHCVSLEKERVFLKYNSSTWLECDNVNTILLFYNYIFSLCRFLDTERTCFIQKVVPKEIGTKYSENSRFYLILYNVAQNVFWVGIKFDLSFTVSSQIQGPNKQYITIYSIPHFFNCYV